MGKKKRPSISLLNHQRVLYLLRTQGPLFRADIARQTRLTKATISKIVEDLERRELVQEIGVEKGGRGRPSILYAFNSASAIAIGVEVLGEEVQAIVTQLDAQPQRTYSHPLSDPSPETLLSVLAKIVADVRNEFTNPIIGMGIGIPGICDEQQKVVVFSERMNWKNLPLAKMIEEKLHLTVWVENRASAAALGERWYGAGADTEDFVYIHIGTGIKAGIIINGELYRGCNGSSGEIGHMTVIPDGPLCVCGKRGCLESVASTLAIREWVISLVGSGKGESLLSKYGEETYRMSLSEMLAAAREGDPTVIHVLSSAARYFGIAVANVVNLLNPKKVILGPFVNEAPPVFLEIVRKTVAEQAFEIPLTGLEIVPTQLGQQAVAIGAAALLLAKDVQNLQPL